MHTKWGEPQRLIGERHNGSWCLPRCRGRKQEANRPANFNFMINEGDKAPDFDLETDEGSRVGLASLKGKNVVLFFYPKDNTSG